MIDIIGAGPAGLYCSYLLAKKNYDVTVYDKKKDIGLPIQCTGILTSKIDNILTLKKEVIKNKVYRYSLHSKNRATELKLRSPDYILDRQKFDRFLYEKAVSAGVGIKLQRELDSINSETLVLKKSKKVFTKKYTTLIGADGPLSKTYSYINPNRPRNYLKGIQFIVKGEYEKDKIDVYFGSVCPDFFAWVVPEDDSTARIGLATKNNPNELINSFLKKLEIKKKPAEIQGGLIPVYDPSITIRKNNIFLLGDAASQVKATTGGGIIQGLTAAQALADSITKEIDYKKEIKKNLSKELWLHLQARRYLDKFQDKDYGYLLDCLDNSKLKSILEKENRDNFSSFFLKLLISQPRLLKFSRFLFR